MTDSVNLDNIIKAETLIDPVFRNTPQYEDAALNAALGRRVLVKVEIANPIRSFKGRGADFLARSLDPKQKIVCASAGNTGQALAYAGRSRGIAVEVFAANDANPAKVDRMRSLGARVTLAGADFDAAKQNARQYAAGHPDCLFVEDGADDAITEGAGTIALEVVAAGAIDAVVVPLGDGALITGIAAWMKFRSPRTRIIGVCPTGTPAMLHAWRNARGVPTVSRDMRDLKSSDVTHTIADGIAVTAPVPKAVEKIKDLVDDIVLVDDHSLIEAMRLSAFTLGLILEPAGAAGLAAIRVHEIPGERIATILTGSNLHPEMLGRIVDSAH